MDRREETGRSYGSLHENGKVESALQNKMGRMEIGYTWVRGYMGLYRNDREVEWLPCFMDSHSQVGHLITTKHGLKVSYF